MSIWHEAYDTAVEAVDDIKRSGGEPTPDQILALAQIYATLSVSRNLASRKDEGLLVRAEDKPPTEQVDEGRPKRRSVGSGRAR